MTGVSHPREEALHDFRGVASWLWYFGPGSWCLSRHAGKCFTGGCGHAARQLLGVHGFCARSLLCGDWDPAAVCLYMQSTSSSVQLDGIPALVPVTVLCLSSRSPQFAAPGCCVPAEEVGGLAEAQSP